MNIEETARASGVEDHDAFFSEWSRMRAGANTPHRYAERITMSLIIAICGWSLIEAPLEYGASNGDSWLLALVVAKLIILVAGATAIADVCFGRSLFAFFCGTSVLAIAPGLPLDSLTELIL